MNGRGRGVETGDGEPRCRRARSRPPRRRGTRPGARCRWRRGSCRAASSLAMPAAGSSHSSAASPRRTLTSRMPSIHTVPWPSATMSISARRVGASGSEIGTVGRTGRPGLRVGERAHRGGIGADDGHAGRLASRNEVGPHTGHPGPQPQRVRTAPASRQSTTSSSVHGPARGGQWLHVVRFAAIPGLRIGVAVDQHGGDRRRQPRVVQVADGVEHAHGGLAMVEDTRGGVMGLTARALLSGRRRRAGRPPRPRRSASGSGTVW